MNIIGVIVPKLVILLTILIPSIDIKNKIILLVVLSVKLMIDYDVAKPGHSGCIYKLTRKAEFEVGELIVACVQFIPAIIFLTATILMRAWIPFIPGIMGALICFISVVCRIKDAIVESRLRREKNAHSDC